MLNEFSPLIELGLTLATDSMIVEGKLTTRRTRLTDLLNDPNNDYLILNDPVFLELGNRRLLGKGAVAQIRMSDVLFVHASDPTESTGVERMPKKPVKATLQLPPFTIDGTIYLPHEADLRMALAAYGDKWEPVTGATYRAYGVAEGLRTVDLLVVNHARAHVSVAAGVAWEADGAPARGASNPW
jgi:hypothetical protein